MADVAVALNITPPVMAEALDLRAELGEQNRRVKELEDNVRRHRDQRAVICAALGLEHENDGWAKAAGRAGELRRLAEDNEKELSAIAAALPPDDAQVPLPARVAQLVREHREMAEEVMKDVDAEQVIAAASQPSDELCQGCGGALCQRCGQCHGAGPSDALVGTCPRLIRRCVQRTKDVADEVARDRTVADLRSFAYIDVVLDGPPAAQSGRFVEVEDPRGRSVAVGDWIDRGDGTWALRISMPHPADDPDLIERPHVMAAIAAMTAVVTTSALDWRRYPCLAWVYGVLVGHHPDEYDDLQGSHGWPDSVIDDIERARQALLAARDDRMA